MKLYQPRKSWKAMWEGETTPHWEVVPMAAELSLLFSGAKRDRVLEIGCGNGILFDLLGFSQSENYHGVDLSSSMIDEFRKRKPTVSLSVGPAEKYEDGNQYDLIFSNGLVQYFDLEMLDEMLTRSMRMLAPHGRIIMASIPWRATRNHFYRGDLTKNPRAGAIQYLKSLISSWKGNFMGRWYDPREIQKAADRQGLNLTLAGSLYYPYRFHAIFNRPEVASTTSKAA
ncbi:MAG: class I SAM-dependent methyltransferase [Planctomycetaceae bacterium]